MDELKPAPQPPRVSVILVSYNCVGALRRALAALEQSRERETFEIIVADNGSVDGSESLDAEFPEVNYLRLEKNFGLTKALNIAVRTAQGEWIFFLSPYIEVKPETVSALLARVAEDSAIGAVCPLIVDEQGKASMRIWKLPSAAAVSAAASGRDLPGAGLDRTNPEAVIEYTNLDALMVTRYFVRGMNYFDERYGQYWQDAELAFQLRQANRKTVVLTGVEVTRMSIPEPSILNQSGARASLAADRALGAAVYAGKRWGFGAKLKLQLGSILGSLGGALTFRSGGFSQFLSILSGQKIDGNQGGL